MTVLTNLQLIRELRKPGKVCLPVETQKSTVYISADKEDLISLLSYLNADDAALWKFNGTTNGNRRLIVQVV